MSRHSWSEPVRFAHKTERSCRACGLVKVTRHEGDRHWTEWWRSLDRIGTGSRVPFACQGEGSGVAGIGAGADSAALPLAKGEMEGDRTASGGDLPMSKPSVGGPLPPSSGWSPSPVPGEDGASSGDGVGEQGFDPLPTSPLQGGGDLRRQEAGR